MTTFHNDNARTGQNTQETILTPANVNSSQFGKLFSLSVDGYVYAQPLYLADISIGGGTHNVVYLATEHDSVYAVDADSGTIYAQVNFIPAGGRTVSASTDLAGCPDLIPEIGISGTPVIDPGTGTLYVVTKAKTAAGAFVQYLHALDVGTLAEKFGGPKLIQPSASGVTFNSLLQFQRPALLLENGHVIIGWSGHCDAGSWHGWVISYSASTLAQEAIFDVTPNGTGGGVWMSGGGIAADANGNLYFPTGNGSWNGTRNFGDSIVKLGPPSGGAFPVLDYFTPWNQATLGSTDTDIASGGLVLFPPLASGEQLLAQQGKLGTLVLLNTGNMGKYCVNQSPACSGSDPNAAQEITGAGGVWGSPAYWNGNFYIVPEAAPIRAYSFNAGNSGKLSTSPTSTSAQVFQFAAPTPAVSANGASDGILWVIDGSAYNSSCGSGSCLGLSAYDATNLTKLLYNSSQSAGGSPGVAVKYATPVIANGKVYVGTQSGLSVYGLLAHVATLTAPAFSLAAGTYTGTQTVKLSDATAGATIYYSTGGVPTTSSARYTTPLTVSASTQLQAIAVDAGYTNSPVSTASYVISAPSGSSSGGGSSSGSVGGVSLASEDSVYGIVSNGSDVPAGGLDNGYAAYSANLLGPSISWGGSTFTFGAAGTANAATSTTIVLPPGSYDSLNLLATSFSGPSINQPFIVHYADGASVTFTQSLSDWGTQSHFAGESTVLTMGYRVAGGGTLAPAPVFLYGYSFGLDIRKIVASVTLPTNRRVVVLAMNLQASPRVTPTVVNPTFLPAAGSYATAQVVSLLDTTPGAAIYYTTDGTKPTTSSAKYSTPMSVSSSETITAIAAANGYINSGASSAAFRIAAAGASSGTAVSVNLSGAGTLFGMVNNGSYIVNGGLDGGYTSYSATLLGSSIPWSGVTFAFGAAGTLNAVSSRTITLPPGNFSSLKLAGTAVNGSQPDQSFVVTYTDGTQTTIQRGVSDWFEPQGYAGESAVATMAYRVAGEGSTSPGPLYLYGYTLALDSTRTVASLTLPTNSHVVVVAASLVH